jgi:hypothetical protein
MKLAQYGTAIVLLQAITLTACSNPSISQPPAVSVSPIASPSIAPGSPFPSVSPTQPSTSASSLQQEAVQVIRDYYSAIAHRDYEQAYLAWEGEGAASQQSFEQFRQGFINTESTAVEVGEPGRVDGAAGSSYIEIPVSITATTTNGTQQQFRGSYVLRRVNDVTGSTLEQRRWHLYSAKITPVN